MDMEGVENPESKQSKEMKKPEDKASMEKKATATAPMQEVATGPKEPVATDLALPEEAGAAHKEEELNKQGEVMEPAESQESWRALEDKEQEGAAQWCESEEVDLEEVATGPKELMATGTAPMEETGPAHKEEEESKQRKEMEPEESQESGQAMEEQGQEGAEQSGELEELDMGEVATGPKEQVATGTEPTEETGTARKDQEDGKQPKAMVPDESREGDQAREDEEHAVPDESREGDQAMEDEEHAGAARSHESEEGGEKEDESMEEASAPPEEEAVPASSKRGSDGQAVDPSPKRPKALPPSDQMVVMFERMYLARLHTEGPLPRTAVRLATPADLWPKARGLLSGRHTSGDGKVALWAIIERRQKADGGERATVCLKQQIHGTVTQLTSYTADAPKDSDRDALYFFMRMAQAFDHMAKLAPIFYVVEEYMLVDPFLWKRTLFSVAERWAANWSSKEAPRHAMAA